MKSSRHAKTAQRGRQTAQNAKSRPTRQTRGKSNELAQFTFSTVQSGSQAFTGLISSVRSSHSLKEVIGHLDLTYPDFGRLLGESPYFKKFRPRGFSKSYLSMLIAGERILTARMLRAIEWVIAKTMTDALGYDIGVKVTRNSPWHFRLSRLCADHGPYELKGNRKHCPQCGK